MANQSNKYTSKLVGKRVLVFGGTSGIGLCVAEAAIEHGAIVIISGSKQEKLNDRLASLSSKYPQAAEAGRIKGYPCNLADMQSSESNMDKMLSEATKDGKLHHIAFLAGDTVSAPPIPQLNVDAIIKLGTVRFISVLLLAKMLPKYMDLSPANSLTTTGGTVADKPLPGGTLLSAWSGAQEAMMRGLAVDLQPLRINMVSPGAVDTALYDGLVSKENKAAFLEQLAAATTTKEVGRPEDVAEAYIYAMKNRFTSGAVINSNGGRLLA
jgi:NAD(P)-dependent dehydrogenase (short-subunit alcohol dehydrogenase family)